MLTRSRLLLTVIALSVAFAGSACGSSGSGDAASDSTTTIATGDANDITDAGASTPTTADSGSNSFGIGIVNLKLDGNGHKIEFKSDEGSCKIDGAAGTAKVSVSKDGNTLDFDYDKSDPEAATIKFTGDGLDEVKGGAGASTPTITDLTIADDEVTGKATMDSPSEGPDKVYLADFRILCP